MTEVVKIEIAEQQLLEQRQALFALLSLRDWRDRLAPCAATRLAHRQEIPLSFAQAALAGSSRHHIVYIVDYGLVIFFRFSCGAGFASHCFVGCFASVAFYENEHVLVRLAKLTTGVELPSYAH